MNSSKLVAQVDSCPTDTIGICANDWVIIEGLSYTGDTLPELIVTCYTIYDTFTYSDMFDSKFEDDKWYIKLQGGQYYSCLTGNVLIEGTDCSFYYKIAPLPFVSSYIVNNYCQAYDIFIDSMYHWGYSVCIGDTTLISTDISNDSLVSDMISIDKGSLTSINDELFYIVWNDIGIGSYAVSETNELGCIVSSGYYIKVKPYEIIDIKYRSSYPDTINTCVGDDITLSIDSSGLTYIKWETSDGNIYYGSEIDLLFEDEGTHSIKASYWQNLCSCTKSDSIIIIGNNGASPIIQCTGTICSGEEITYYADSDCDQYLWNVSNHGDIIDGGGNEDDYITVLWNYGPLGELSLTIPDCLIDACRETTIVDIPIINNTTNIEGPVDLCYNTISTYTAPSFTGTYFQWSISNNGTILSGNGTNEIVVQWHGEGYESAIINLSYDNCSINCTGHADLKVSFLPNIDIIISSDEYCYGDSLLLTTGIGLNLDWSIISPNGIVMDTTTVDIMLSLEEVGTYRINVSNPFDNTCEEFEHYNIICSHTPITPEDIDGAGVVCKDLPSIYKIKSLGISSTVYWEFFDGDTIPIYTTESRSVSYHWMSDGPYAIKVKVINTKTGCESESKLFELSKIDLISGDADACLNKDYYYRLNGDITDAVEWKIQPFYAGEVLDVDDELIFIKWKRSGNHQLIANYCGQIIEYDINIESAHKVNVKVPPTLCYHEKGEVIIKTIPDDVDIYIYTNYNHLVSTSKNPMLNGGEYNIISYSERGCKQLKKFKINKDPYLEVKIERGLFCPPASFKITSKTSPGAKSYLWYRNGVSTGVTSSTLVTNLPGKYYLEVTNFRGCPYKSNTVTVIIPTGSDLCTSCTEPLLNANIMNTGCFTRDFSILQPHSSTTFTWNFGDSESGTNNTATGFDVSHEFSKNGTFHVVATGDNPDDEACFIVLIGNNVGFEYKTSCFSLNAKFINHSDYSYSNPLHYKWIFGDPATGNKDTSTFRHPNHKFSEYGTYFVTLDVTNQDGCVTRTSSNIILNPISYDIIAPNNACEDTRVKFKIDPSGSYLSYRWKFDDPSSGFKNTSKLSHPSHWYNNEGNYKVRLTITDRNGCKKYYTKNIRIHKNNFYGKIKSNIPLPKCPDDISTLTAPATNATYKWSTGETTRKIDAIYEGYYRVTITNSYGCTYKPPSFYVSNKAPDKGRILAKVFDGITGFTIVEDSLEICIDDKFDLICSLYPDAEYIWSTGYNGRELLYMDQLKDLPVGDYIFSVDISLSSINCDVTIDPFFVQILDRPSYPILKSSTEVNCDGETSILTIDNPESNVDYLWNTGSTETEISTSVTGIYQVTATNSIGCASVSNDIIISDNPSASIWMTGCREVCLPDQFCLNLPEGNTYKLIKNGEVVKELFTADDMLDVEDAGDYQLLVVNSVGCETRSDVLSLEASPIEHNISGTVYYDKNANNVYDENDVLLKDVPVKLFDGINIIDTTITDQNGFYIFDTLNLPHLTAIIDPSDLNYTLKGATDSLIVFDECIEARIIDFPMISDCTIPERLLEYGVCMGDYVKIAGNNYTEGEKDTLVYHITNNCDSIVMLRIFRQKEPELTISVDKSCKNESTGVLYIHMDEEDSLTYTIDEINYVNDSILYDLNPGGYELTYIDTFGCEYDLPFEISHYDEPIVELEVFKTCDGENQGQMKISIISGTDLKFNLNSDSTYSEVSSFQHLTKGNHTLFIQDDNLCSYEIPFEIQSYDQTKIDIALTNACDQSDLGKLIIDIQSGNPLFSIDSISDFTNTITYIDISIGTHMIYTLSEDGCYDSIPFSIDIFKEPNVDINTESICQDVQSGSMSIITSNDSLVFAIDSSDYGHDVQFDSLTEGVHTLYIQTEVGCNYSKDFEIAYYSIPEVEIETIMTCENQNTGRIIVIGTSIEQLSISIDESTYNVLDSVFEFLNLEEGEHVLNIINNANCQYDLPFEIKVQPLPELNVDITSSCANTDSGIIILSSNNEFNTFSINESNPSSQTVYEDLSAGEYWIEAIDTLGCTTKSLVEVNLYPELIIEVPDFELDCYPQEVKIAPIVESHQGSLSYEWQDGSNLSEFTAFESGRYEVTITDLCDEVTNTWDLDFTISGDEKSFFVPNIFGMTMEESNNCFRLDYKPTLEIITFHVSIYDRWGSRMFESSDISSCWDGHFKGEPVVNGVYIYVIDLLVNECVGTKKLRKTGDVTVLN